MAPSFVKNTNFVKFYGKRHYTQLQPRSFSEGAH